MNTWPVYMALAIQFVVGCSFIVRGGSAQRNPQTFIGGLVVVLAAILIALEIAASAARGHG